jgi:hypothetical protein
MTGLTQVRDRILRHAIRRQPRDPDSGRRSFASLREARAFMEAEVDRPVTRQRRTIATGIVLRVFSRALSGGAFTNVYDVSWEPDATTAGIGISARPADIRAMGQARSALVAASAGFFVLGDKAAALPRQVSLHLAISDGRIVSLPVADREAVLSRDGTLSAAYIRAEGRLMINGRELTWTGSRTGRPAQCYVYGNGNAVITHQHDPVTGTARVLDEASRLTPAIRPGSQMADVGFIATGDGGFRLAAVSTSGGMDIFSHDAVVRCPAGAAEPGRVSRMDILQVGPLPGHCLPDSAVSAGPCLEVADFAAHPVNHDPALGSLPPFMNRRMARLVLYQDQRSRTHLRLFDGRPESRSFAGVTPAEARDAIAADTGFRWGCFLDPGQTARIWLNRPDGLVSYGNRHYLRWPESPTGRFTWVPGTGRPVPSIITVMPGRARTRP